MKILLLGATGRTGKHVLKLLLERDCEVSCLVRKPERLPKHPLLVIHSGNPTNIQNLKHAIEDCDAVLSVLNISRTTDFPWSPLRTPKRFLSDTIQNIVALSNNQDLKQVIVCSAWGVGETKAHIPFWFRWTIDLSNIRFAYKDHERQEEILKKSGLNYTIIRPVGLTNLNRVKPIKESIGNSPKPNLFITRLSLATYMVKCLLNTSTTNKIIVISNS